MQGKKSSNAQITTNRKASGSRMGTQQNQPQNNPPATSSNANSVKQRDEALYSIVKQYLQKSGYARTVQTFKTQKPAKRILPAISGRQVYAGIANSDEKSIINLFDKGNREQFFKLTDKMFTLGTNNSSSEQIAHALRRLQFQLNIYFCIFSIHPATPGQLKKNQVDKQSAEAFKKYIDTKGQQVSQQTDLLTFFALPYIPKPQQNPSMIKVFTKQWILRLKANLQQTLREFNSRNTANSNKQNKKSNYASSLHEIYDRYFQSSVSQSRIKEQESRQIDHKIVEKYERQIQQLKMHNKEMISYLDIMQQNIKDLNQASKTNLVESNGKWFQFSKQVLQLAKKAQKGESIKDDLQKYQRFFGTNIDDLIYCTDDISLFEKNSYTEDASMIPKNPPNMIDRISIGNNPLSTQLTPIDYTKIFNLFSKSDKPDLQLEACLVLKALKDRLCFHKNAYTRRQVVVSYQRNDLCGIKDNNYWIQKKLLLLSGEKVKQFYLRLMNYISTDDLGNQYLSVSQKLIQNLMNIMGSSTQDTPYRKHAMGILQRLSYIKQSQLMMISFGIIPMIFQIFRNEGEQLSQTSIQYLMGLIMNLAVKQSIMNFEKHKSQVLPILLKFIDVDDNKIKGYVNGTLYLLLQLESIKKQALQKHKLKQILINLLQKSTARLNQLNQDESQPQSCLIRQYEYIIQRFNETGTTTKQNLQNQYYQDEDDDEIQQNCVEDINDDMDIFSQGDDQNQSEYLEGEQNFVTGEELLMKKYALLGPEAVREEIINRSILDQTGRKSNNMTTSINYSKRIDKVFHKNQRPQTPSLLPNSLDLSINPTR